MLHQKEKYETPTEKIHQRDISNKSKSKPEDQAKKWEDSFENTHFIYDYQLLDNLLDHSKLLKRLKPEAQERLLGQPKKYTYLKKFALERLEETIWRQLNLLFNLNHCRKEREEPDEKLTHHIFNWSMQEFLNRRTLKDFVWIDVMLKISENCLHKYKFKKDLEELQKYLEYIFNGIFSSIENREMDVDKHVVEPINNCKILLQIQQNVEKEFHDNTNYLKEISESQLISKTLKRDTEKRFTAIFLRNRITNNYIWDPIEKRYNLNWYRSNVEQTQHRMNRLQQNYERDIENLRNKTFLETACSNNCMDYYYSSIEQLKNSINEVQMKFDTASEEMENNLSYKRIQIDKLREQRQWLMEQIGRFHEEIEAMRLRQEREAEEEERLRLEEEELAAERAEEKLKKVKKGKKNKGGNIKSGKAAKF